MQISFLSFKGVFCNLKMFRTTVWIYEPPVFINERSVAFEKKMRRWKKFRRFQRIFLFLRNLLALSHVKKTKKLDRFQHQRKLATSIILVLDLNPNSCLERSKSGSKMKEFVTLNFHCWTKQQLCKTFLQIYDFHIL